MYLRSHTIVSKLLLIKQLFQSAHHLIPFFQHTFIQSDFFFVKLNNFINRINILDFNSIIKHCII